MEPIFTASFVFTPQVCKELFRRTHRIYSIPVWLLSALCLYSAVNWLLTLILFETTEQVAALYPDAVGRGFAVFFPNVLQYLLYAAALAALGYFMPDIAANRFYKRYVELSGRSDGIVEATFFHDHFVQENITTGKTKYTLEYNKVKKLLSTKNLYLLQTKQRTLFYFPKDSFTKGSPKEFEAFITAAIGRKH